MGDSHNLANKIIQYKFFSVKSCIVRLPDVLPLICVWLDTSSTRSIYFDWSNASGIFCGVVSLGIGPLSRFGRCDCLV